MADLSDVEEALVATIAAAVFPNESYLPGASQFSTIIGANLKVFRGWPVANELNAELAAGACSVSVFSGSGATRNVTWFAPEWEALPQAPPSLLVSYTATTVTFSGTCAAGQTAGIGVGNQPYAYAVLGSDTPTTVAAALAAMIPGASSAGGVVTVPTGIGLVGRVAQLVTAVRIIRQQQQQVTVTIWCPTPMLRDQLSSAVDAALAGMEDASGNLTLFMTLPSGEAVGPVNYVRSLTNDAPGVDKLWRRDLVYMVEYATQQTQQQPEMLFGTVVSSGSVMPNGGTVTTLDAKSVGVTINGNPLVNAGGTEL